LEGISLWILNADKGTDQTRAYHNSFCRIASFNRAQQRISNTQESGRGSAKFGLTTKRVKEQYECHSQ
jgi:hypothetical protein